MVVQGAKVGKGKKKDHPVKKYPESSYEFIKSITSLKRRARSDQALDLLHKISALVKPIMKNHGLKVGTLCEFYPKNKSLLGLNVNHGVKICLRLRFPSNENDFLPFESILGTALHELSHNKFGPHDAKFYKYLDELTKEMELLMAQGYTGDGFFSKGNTLGGRNLSLAEARKKSADILEHRATLSAGSGQKLGGSSKPKGQSIKDLIRQAAERRAADATSCGNSRLGHLTKDDLGDDSEIEEINMEDWIESRRVGSNETRRPVDESSAKTRKKPKKDIPCEIIDLTNDP